MVDHLNKTFSNPSLISNGQLRAVSPKALNKFPGMLANERHIHNRIMPHTFVIDSFKIPQGK
jgi:hypothetical protein